MKIIERKQNNNLSLKLYSHSHLISFSTISELSHYGTLSNILKDLPKLKNIFFFKNLVFD